MQISKTTNHGNLRWRVTLSLKGKRQQRFFSSRDDAREWMRSIEGGHDGFWKDRTVEEQRGIVSAFNLVSEKGLSIYRCFKLIHRRPVDQIGAPEKPVSAGDC